MKRQFSIDLKFMAISLVGLLGLLVSAKSTSVSYSLEIVDAKLGNGLMKFSHPVNMEWLEGNFYDIFDAYHTLAKDGDSGKKYVLLDFS